MAAWLRQVKEKKKIISLSGNLGKDHLDDEEEDLIKKVFSQADRNNSGNLSIAELRTLLRGSDFFGFKATKNDVDTIIRIMDVDNTGTIDFEEFRSVIGEWLLKQPAFTSLSPKQRAGLRSLFDRYDADKGGFIDIKELKKLLSELGDFFGFGSKGDDIESLMKVLDVDKSGTVSFEEFLAEVGDWVLSLDGGSEALDAALAAQRAAKARKQAALAERRKKKLSKEEEAYVQNMFLSFDANGSGSLSRQELRKLLHEADFFGFVPNDGDVEVLLRMMDKDDTGTVDYFEFHKVVSQWLMKKPAFLSLTNMQREEIKSTFSKYSNHAGLISPEDIEEMVATASGGDFFGFSKKQVPKLVDQLDKNSDGEIDLDEFMRGMAVIIQEKEEEESERRRSVVAAEEEEARARAAAEEAIRKAEERKEHETELESHREEDPQQPEEKAGEGQASESDPPTSDDSDYEISDDGGSDIYPEDMRRQHKHPAETPEPSAMMTPMKSTLPQATPFSDPGTRPQSCIKLHPPAKGVDEEEEYEQDERNMTFASMIDIHRQVIDKFLHYGREDMGRADYSSALKHLTLALKTKPKNCDVLYQRGLCYLYLKKYNSATKDFQKILDLNPLYDLNTHILLSLCFKKRGEKLSAIRTLTKALTRHADFVEAYVARGELYLKDEKFDKAMQDFQAVIALQPTNAVGYRGLGDTFTGLTDVKEGINYYSKALSLLPSYEDAYVKRAQAYVNTGKLEEAFSDVNEVIGLNARNEQAIAIRAEIYMKKKEYFQAIRDYDEVLGLVKKSDFIYKRGMCYLKLDKFVEALSDFQQTLRMRPKHPDAQVYRGLVKAALHLQDGEYEKAIGLLDVVITRKPKNGRGWLYRGYAYSCSGVHNEAFRDLNKALQLKTGGKAAQYNRGLSGGIVSCSREDHNSAISSFSNCIKLFPQMPEPYFFRALATVNMHSSSGSRRPKGSRGLENALEDICLAIDRDSTNAKYLYHRAVIFQILKDHENTIRDLDRALEFDDTVVEYFVARALSYACLREFERAIEDLGSALSLDEHNVEAYLLRGQCEYGRGNFDAAIENFEMAIGIDPRNPSCYSHMGDLLLCLRNVDEAFDAYSVAIKLSNFKSHYAYHQHARIHLSRGNVDLALKDLNKVVEQNPTNRTSQFDREVCFGLNCALRAEYHRATIHFTKTLQSFSDPNVQQSIFHLTHLFSYRGCCHWYLGDTERGLSDLNKSNEFIDEPGSDFFYNTLLTHLTNKDYHPALECCHRGVELMPQCATFYFLRGLVKICLGRKEESKADFVDACRYDTSMIDGYLGKKVVVLQVPLFDKAKLPTYQSGFIKIADCQLEVKPVMFWPSLVPPSVLPSVDDFDIQFDFYTNARCQPICPWVIKTQDTTNAVYVGDVEDEGDDLSQMLSSIDQMSCGPSYVDFDDAKTEVSGLTERISVTTPVGDEYDE